MVEILPIAELRKAVREALSEELLKHLSYLEWAQTLVIELSLVIPVPVGTYDTVLEPEDGKLWYLGYVEITTSANTSTEVYIRGVDGGGEALVLAAGKGSTASKDFKETPKRE